LQSNNFPRHQTWIRHSLSTSKTFLYIFLLSQKLKQIKFSFSFLALLSQKNYPKKIQNKNKRENSKPVNSFSYSTNAISLSHTRTKTLSLLE